MIIVNPIINYIKEVYNSGFKGQLIIAFMTGIIITTIFSTYLISSFSSRTVGESLESTGYQITQDLVDRSTLTLLYLSEESAKEVVNAIKNFRDVSGVAIYGADKKPLIKDGKNTFPVGAEEWPEVLTLVKQTEEAWYFVSPVYSRGSSTDTDSLPFIEEVENELIGYVRIRISKSTLRALQNNIFWINVLISVLLSTLLILILSSIVDRVIKPIKELARIMLLAEEGDMAIRSIIGGNHDISLMQRAFNAMIRSIGDREKNLESARQAALSYAHAKGEFAANVSHELRTPLNGILGMLEILDDTTLSPKQKEYVAVARGSGNALQALIDDILNFSKLDAGKSEVKSESFNLHETLDDIIGVLTTHAVDKDLDIAYVIDHDVPSRVEGESSRIRQLLLNLGGNAVKFTSKGEVAFLIKNVTHNGENLRLRFEVKDTGIGIPKEVADEIFEAFKQADASTTKQFGGTGLGLAICRQLVETMHGEIGVDSVVGEGSTFWFELPFSQSFSTDEIPSPTKTTVAGLRVLVVDSSEIVRANLKQTFESWGATITCESYGDDSINLLREATRNSKPYDIALIDETISDINGIELILSISKDDKINPLKLVLLSNHKNPAAFIQRFREIDAFIRKPIRQSSLFDCVMEFLDTPADSHVQSIITSSVLPLGTKPNFDAMVLVVEDNRANQQVVQAMLERLGCKSTIAINGIEALKLLEHAKFDLVFMDCNMPEMDGYEATKKIRQMPSKIAQIPIIAMTANVLDGDREKCIRAGMNDYAQKPLKLDVVTEKLLCWLEPKDINQTDDVLNIEDNEQSVTDTQEQEALDQAVIEELKDMVGNGFYDMVEVYVEDMAILLRSLEKSILEKDSKSLTHYAHTIKGSSSNFGAARLTRIAKQLEENGRNNTFVNAEVLMLALFGEADVVINLLKQEAYAQKEDTLLGRVEKESILIADDDRSMRVALQNVLAADGYEVEAVSDGVEAVSRCERKMPDIILLDALMPNLNGFNACKKIRMLQDSTHVPILIVTALDDEKSIELAFESGATDYIPKPIHFAVMRQRISRLLQASRAEVHVRQLAYNDSLTGLPNRTMFIAKMEKLLARVRPRTEKIAVLFLDLDRFKYVNDTLGHSVGDMLLKGVAERIMSCIRVQDTVARLGGDEFTMALDGIEDAKVIASIADKICTKLAESYSFAGRDIFVTASIGIAVYPDDGTDVDMLMKRADTAMFRAKEQGSSFQFYEKEMEVIVTNKVEIEQDLRHALEREELDVYFQPKLDLITSSILGAEALVRWNHPDKGLVGPDKFIPLAEETGLISELGLWVLITACVQVQSWIDQGYKAFPISVNLSGRQLENNEITEQIEHVLSRSGLAPEYLELEITESTIMKRPEEVISILHQLKVMGVQLSIDDFGTGYSSLNYLRKFPIDLLKIDQSFVKDIAENNEDRLIVKGIIALAKSLNLKVLAEGVETAEQKEFLLREGCDYIQGYYFGKPMKADDFLEEFIKMDRSNIQFLSDYRQKQ